MWAGVIENFHLHCDKLIELERLESLIMGESGINSYTLQPLAHFAKLFTFEILPARPEFNVIFEAPAGRPDISFLGPGRRTIYGAAEFIRPFDGRAHAHLFGFYIDESLRGGGAASMFLKACEKRLGEGYSICTIDLTVSEQNGRARAFYTKNGYTAAETAGDYYGPGRGRLIMSKTISGVAGA